MNTINVDVVKMYPDVIIPKYQTSGSAGCDVCAYILNTQGEPSRHFLLPNDILLVPTGLKFKVPDGYEMQIRPRSGLSLKTKLRIANSPGTLDCDYIGELKIIVENIGSQEIQIIHGDRIAQLIFAPVLQANFAIKDSLEQTERGSGGFGSTGSG